MKDFFSNPSNYVWLLLHGYYAVYAVIIVVTWRQRRQIDRIRREIDQLDDLLNPREDRYNWRLHAMKHEQAQERSER